MKGLMEMTSLPPTVHVIANVATATITLLSVFAINHCRMFVHFYKWNLPSTAISIHSEFLNLNIWLSLKNSADHDELPNGVHSVFQPRL